MEQIAKTTTVFISHSVEILAAIIIGIAVIKTMSLFAKNIFSADRNFSQEEIRVKFGSNVAISLELLLGADVLSTAVAPSWDDIGKLAAIAILRTALNYFLEKELKHMRSNSSGNSPQTSNN